MNLYLVERTNKIELALAYMNSDEYESFVCAAHNEEQARTLRPDDSGGSWDEIAVTYIGMADGSVFTEPTIILASMYRHF